MDINGIFKVFLTYSFLGWTVENLRHPKTEAYNSFVRHYLPQTSCLIPFLPIYGLGGLFIMYLYKSHPKLSIACKIILFVLAFNLIEFIGGYISEHCICSQLNTCPAGKKIWDYTGFGNVNGYIDLEHTVYWIILGLIGYY